VGADRPRLRLTVVRQNVFEKPACGPQTPVISGRCRLPWAARSALLEHILSLVFNLCGRQRCSRVGPG
jgi:hypothetical protein